MKIMLDTNILISAFVKKPRIPYYKNFIKNIAF